MDSLTKKLVAGWLLSALTENDIKEIKFDVKHAIKLLLDLEI